jgi:hypothetical protein
MSVTLVPPSWPSAWSSHTIDTHTNIHN